MTDDIDPSIKYAKKVAFWLRVLISLPIMGVVLLCLVVLLMDFTFSGAGGHGRPVRDSWITLAWLAGSLVLLWLVIPRRVNRSESEDAEKAAES